MSHDRLEKEREFHNHAFAENTRAKVAPAYAVTGSSYGYFYDQLLRRAPGANALEYGCGQGSSAYDLARAGATVTGIDISDVAIRQATEKAAQEDVADRTRFEVMNAEELRFEDDSFDLACGSAIIHHLEIDRAFAELARTLKPTGTAFFLEPLGHNPAVNLYRKRTPDLRTEDEHPLLVSDLEAASRRFGKVDIQYFHMASLAAIPFAGRRGFGGAVKALDAVDRALFRAIPPARRWAWIVVMSLGQPHKR